MLRFFRSLRSTSRIYLDYAAATPLDPRVYEATRPYWSEHFGNPSSIHQEGVAAARALRSARDRIATLLHAHADELVFTSGGTEANNLAIQGVSDAVHRPLSEQHFITTTIEHPSILEVLRSLAEKGAQVTYLGVGADGRIRPKEVMAAVRNTTVLITTMLVNNEIGSIQPVRDVAKELRAHKKKSGSETCPYVHADASQAPLWLTLDMRRLGVDLLTLDAHKLCGPKGVGLLYRRRGRALAPQMIGGGQEGGLRAGTEPVPLIVGFAEALSLAHEKREEECARIAALRNYFTEHVKERIPSVVINGGTAHRIPGNVNIAVPGLESEFMTLWLDARGIACGARSACVSAEGGPSLVLRELGQAEDIAASSLRFTFGRHTTKGEIRKAVDALAAMVQTLT